MRVPVTCWIRCLRCRSIWTTTKPSVAKRNMPAAMYWRPPVLAPLIVATSTIEPSEPSIGIAFISTPLAPSACSICGGGCSWSWPWGSSGSSSRPPRSAPAPAPEVCVDEPVADSAGVRPPPAGGATRGTGGLSVVVTALPHRPEYDPFDDRCAPEWGN